MPNAEDIAIFAGPSSLDFPPSVTGNHGQRGLLRGHRWSRPGVNAYQVHLVSRRVDMFAITATELTAEGMANVLINR